MVTSVTTVSERPYVLLSCSMSIDGYHDAATEKRLLLSNDDDFDRVDAVRAECDAILVGAATVRQDNPRLLVRSQARRAERVARGLRPSPLKVTVTRRAQLDRGPSSSSPATATSWCTARARQSTTRASGWAGWPRSSTAASRLICSGCRRICTPGAWAGSWLRAAEPCTPSSSPPTSPTSCTWWWRRS